MIETLKSSVKKVNKKLEETGLVQKAALEKASKKAADDLELGLKNASKKLKAELDQSKQDSTKRTKALTEELAKT